MRWLAGLVLVVAVACAGRVGGDDGETDETSSSASSSSTGESVSSSIGETVSSSTDTSTSSSTGVDASSSSDGTTAESPTCDCTADEVCIERSSDTCSDPHVPVTECIPRPDACTDDPIVCDTACGWEACGGPGCTGLGEEVCGVPSEGLVCNSSHVVCNLFTQDCPKGERCASWDSDADQMFDATRCAPIFEDPVPVGGVCMSKSSPWSGIDDCVEGALCLLVNDGDPTGICRAACVGNPYDATCDDPETTCVLEGDYFAWCVPE